MSEQDDLGRIVDTLRKRWRPVLAGSVITAVATAAVLLLKAATFTSSASFTLSGRRTPAQFSGLAAQLGVNLPQSDASQSPAFYVDLLRSRTVLEPLLNDTLPPQVAQSGPRHLLDVMEIKAASEALRHEFAFRAMNERLLVTLNPKSGVVAFTYRGPNPIVAQWVASRLLAEVSTFNMLGRRTQAMAERRFTERRLQESRQRLAELEEEAVAFRRRNRGVGNSPDLDLARERLEREVSMQQQVAATLTQAFEQARLEEVRDTPVISVVEQPLLPATADRRFVLSRTLIAAVLGAALVAGVSIVPILRRSRVAGVSASPGATVSRDAPPRVTTSH